MTFSALHKVELDFKLSDNEAISLIIFLQDSLYPCFFLVFRLVFDLLLQTGLILGVTTYKNAPFNANEQLLLLNFPPVFASFFRG